MQLFEDMKFTLIAITYINAAVILACKVVFLCVCVTLAIMYNDLV